MSKYVPRSLQNIHDRLAARNERIDKESFSRELPKTFEVVIYDTKSPAVNSTTTQDAPNGADGTASEFYYYRARSKAEHHDWLDSPNSARSIDEYESFRNQHFQAGLKKGFQGETLPVTGEVWLATHVKGNFVTLISKSRTENIKFDFTAGTARPAQAAHTNGQNQTTTVGSASTGTGIGANGQYSQEIQDELAKSCKLPKVFVINSGASAFITKIKSSPSFSTWSGPALAGVVANAQGESNYIQSAPGDRANGYGGSNVSQKRKEQVRKRKIKVDGIEYCSWGYWQFNICPESAAGSQLAKDSSIDVETTSGKAEWLRKLKDDEFQFAFAAKEMAKITSKDGTDPYVAGSDIVLKFERPACKNIHALERGNLAVLIYNKYKAELDA